MTADLVPLSHVNCVEQLFITLTQYRFKCDPNIYDKRIYLVLELSYSLSSLVVSTLVFHACGPGIDSRSG